MPVVTLGAPKMLVLIAANSAKNRRDTAAKVRDLDNQVREPVQHAAVDQTHESLHQGEFAPHGARQIIGIVLGAVIQLQGRVDEDIKAEALRFGPELVEFGIIEIAVEFGRNDHAGEPQFILASRQLLEGVRPAKRVGMGRSDKPARIILGGFVDFVIGDTAAVQRAAHAFGAAEDGGIDTGHIHHSYMLV